MRQIARALPGSRYLMFVTLEYDDHDGHHAAVAHDMVEIRAASPLGAIYSLVGAAALMLVWIVLVARRHGTGLVSPGAKAVSASNGSRGTLPPAP